MCGQSDYFEYYWTVPYRSEKVNNVSKLHKPASDWGERGGRVKGRKGVRINYADTPISFKNGTYVGRLDENVLE